MSYAQATVTDADSNVQKKSEPSHIKAEKELSHTDLAPIVEPKPRKSSRVQDDYIVKLLDFQLPPVSTRVRPADVQHAIRARMITSAELADRFPPQPLVDSSAAQSEPASQNIVALQKALSAFESVGQLTLDVLEKNETDLSALAEIKSAMQAKSIVIENATAEKNILTELEKIPEPNEFMQSEKVAMLKQKKEWLENIIAAAHEYENTIVNALADAKSDPVFNGVKASVTLDQSMMIKRRGISFADCNFSYNDKTCKSSEKLKAGVASEVCLKEYKDGYKGVFKTEVARTDFRNSQGLEINAPKALKMKKEEPRIGNRNIATRVVADLLGVSVIPNSCYVFAGDEIGLLMDFASGKEPAREKPGQKPWTKEKPPTAEEKAQLQAQLNELEWTDLLTGQMDRHDKNYLVEAKSGQVRVTGIDNDYAFGSGDGSGEIKRSKYSYSATLQAAAHHGGMPALLDAKIAKKIETLDETVARDKLQGLLSKDEVDATVARIAKLKEYGLELKQKNCLVSDWVNGLVGPDKVAISVYLAEKAKTDRGMAGRGEGYSSLFMRDFGEFA